MTPRSVSFHMTYAKELLVSLCRRGALFWIDKGVVHYRAPSDGMRRDEIHSLRAHKSEIVDLLHDAATWEILTQAGQRASRTVPAAFQQEWFWHISRHNREWNHFTAAPLRLHGRLDVAALIRSVSALVYRHESLRTQITTSEGKLTQLIENKFGVSLDVISLTELSECAACSRAKGAIEEALRERTGTPCSTFIAKLFVLSQTDHILLVAVHHMVTDAISFSRCLQELWTIYRGLASGRAPTLVPVAMQYTDYVEWQRNDYRTALDRRDSYWERRLTGASSIKWIPDQGLGTARPYGPVTTRLSLDPALSDKLRVCARHLGAVPGVLVLAALCHVVHRLCDQRDFILPFVFNGRHNTEHLAVMGLFIYPVLLRIQIDVDGSVFKTVGDISAELLSACENADFGICAVNHPELTRGIFVQWVSWDNDSFNSVPASKEWNGSPDLPRAEPFPIAHQGPENPIMETHIVLYFEDRPDGIHANVVYRGDLFALGTINDLWERLRAVCSSTVSGLIAADSHLNHESE